MTSAWVLLRLSGEWRGVSLCLFRPRGRFFGVRGSESEPSLSMTFWTENTQITNNIYTDISAVMSKHHKCKTPFQSIIRVTEFKWSGLLVLLALIIGKSKAWWFWYLVATRLYMYIAYLENTCTCTVRSKWLIVFNNQLLYYSLQMDGQTTSHLAVELTWYRIHQQSKSNTISTTHFIHMKHTKLLTCNWGKQKYRYS